jgi:diguanylate cyclase (GGDEF)-like protein/PAS domain S-box-containing protein
MTPGVPGEPALRQLIFDNADGILVLRPDGVVVFANAAASQLLRSEGAPLVGTDFGRPATAGKTAEVDIPATGRVAEMRVSQIEWEGAPALLASLRDITERRSAERSRLQLAAIVEASADAIAGLNDRGDIETWNMGAEQLYGYTSAEVLGRCVLILAAPEDVAAQERSLARLLSGGRGEHVQTRDRRKDGSLVDVSVTISPICEPGGGVMGVARVARDISEQKRLERELAFLADHDPLTGLFNRRRMNEELARQCAMAARYGETGALLLGDLDHFKDINDSLGHQAGDTVIRRVAQTISVRLRDTDVPARLGGDEFAIMLPRTNLEGAQRTAEFLRRAVSEIDLRIQGSQVRVNVSFGVAVVEGPVASPENVLAVADLAMYEAKHEGRDRVVAVSVPPATGVATEALALSDRLRATLRGREFELHAQPVIDLTTAAVHRYELLLHPHEGGGLLPPETLGEASEGSAVMGEIDRRVVRHALKALRSRGEDEEVQALAVNLSGASIDEDGIAWLLEQEMRRHGISPSRLDLVLSEAASAGRIDAAHRLVERLHQVGCSVTLGGFGSGYGSFRHLRYLPVDYLKIDGDLVRQLSGSRLDRLLVKAIVDVAHGLDIRTIAEGIDSEDVLAPLRECGVEFGQGSHLGRPRPLRTGRRGR